MDLLAAAHAYTEQHFSEIVHGEEFLNLPAMQICELISSDQLTVASEEKVNCQPSGAVTEGILWWGGMSVGCDTPTSIVGKTC